ncbi:MAG: HD domain-containing protein [Bacilli bacterium]|nr:HD domain-containing protein [Bacilli bacterium]
MNKDSFIFKLLEKLDTYQYFELYFTTIPDEKQKYFLDLIEHLRTNKLYPGLIHGKYHSEKVALFAFIIGEELHLDDRQMKILMDAAMYHDFKRQSDFEEPLHGYGAAYNIDEIIGGDPFYKEGHNRELLQAIIDNHSTKQGRSERGQQLIFGNYELDQTEVPFEEFSMLASILMDADALDRLRFSKASFAALKPEFLRYDFSRDLIPLAEEVNRAYQVFDMYKAIDFSKLEKLTGAVCHSAGFIFSRIPFILKHGVLSRAEQLAHSVDIERNFDGGNAQRWVSVVPVSLIREGNTSNAPFLDNGIVIRTFEDQEYYRSSYTQHDASIAGSSGLPYIKGGHKEERFVFERVRPDMISEIYISKKCASKDIKDLRFIFPNIDYVSYQRLVNQLLVTYESSPEDRKKINEVIKVYINLINVFGSLPAEERRLKEGQFVSELEKLNEEVNKYLGIVIKKYYAKKFGLHYSILATITPVYVLEDELLSKGIPYVKEEHEDRISFKINLNKRKKIEEDIGYAPGI